MALEKKVNTPQGGVAEEPKLEKLVEEKITPVVVPPVETVTLKKTELDDLMARLKRVEFAADKSHLAHFDEKNKKVGAKTVKLAMIDGKVILSWPDMSKNLVEKTPSGGWFEDQKIELHYEDGTVEEMEYVYFIRRRKSLIAEVLSKTVENAGEEGETIILKVITSDGREYSIDKKFVN